MMLDVFKFQGLDLHPYMLIPIMFNIHISISYWLCILLLSDSYMGVSENSVPLNPMVNDHYPY